MVLSRSLLVLAAAGVNVVRAQSSASPNQTSSDPNPGRCEGETDPVNNAAAWGVGGQLPAANGNAADYYQWLFTVSGQGMGEVFLISRPGVSLPDETSADDYCMMSFNLPLHNLLLAQTDDGSCDQTFGADCVQSMKDAATQGLTSVGGANNQNEFCLQLGDAVAKAFQTSASCKASNPNGTSIDIASYFTPKDSFCSNSTSGAPFPGYGASSVGAYYNYNFALNSYYNNDTYAKTYRTVWPMLAVTLSSVTDTLIMPKSYMGCPRVTDKVANATVPSALPSPSSSLSPSSSSSSPSPSPSSSGNAAIAVHLSEAGNSLLGAFVVSIILRFL